MPYDSPIHNTGILFYNTLFDENASCHFAFGAAYPGCVKGGEEMERGCAEGRGAEPVHDPRGLHGGQPGFVHRGDTRDGREIPVFVNGNFAF